MEKGTERNFQNGGLMKKAKGKTEEKKKKMEKGITTKR